MYVHLTHSTIKVVAIIQARLGSTRLPNKVMQTVDGIPMVKRVWLAAKASEVDEVIVAWPERYPDLDENNVLERFRRIARETNADVIVRLTADCPLLTKHDINHALDHFHGEYFSNHYDGHDVQVFTKRILFGDIMTHQEHVIDDPSNPITGLSVNTKEDLERVRELCKIK